VSAAALPGGTARARSLRLTAGAIGATATAAAPLFLLGALAVQVRADLGFGAAGLGVAVATLFAASALTGPVVFRAIERIGARTGVAITSVLCAIALVAIAVSVDSFAGLLAAMALAGAAQAFGQPSANGLLSRGLPAGRQGLAFGLKQMAVPLTSLLAGAAVPLVALTVGWRWAYAGAAVLVLLVPLAVPRRDASAVPVRGGGRATLSPALLLLAVAGALAAASTMTLGSFLVDNAVSRGVSESGAGLLLLYGSAVAVGARLLLGWLADRTGFDPSRIMLMMLLLGAPALALLGIAPGRWPLMAVVTVAFGAGWGWNGLMDLTIVRLNRASPAAATSLMLTGFFLGAALGPLAFGTVAETLGYPTAWVGAGALLLAGAGAIAAARRLATA